MCVFNNETKKFFVTKSQKKNQKILIKEKIFGSLFFFFFLFSDFFVSWKTNLKYLNSIKCFVVLPFHFE
jgi:hypothetical protein